MHLFYGVPGGSGLHKTAATAMQSDAPLVATGDDRAVTLVAQWRGGGRRQQTFEAAAVRYCLLEADAPEGDRAIQAPGARGAATSVTGQHVVRGRDAAELKSRPAPLGYGVLSTPNPLHLSHLSRKEIT